MTDIAQHAAHTQAHTHAHPETDTAAERRLETRILITVLVALIGWGLSIWTWGVPGLYIPALALVPVLYVLLILISRG